jgi:PPOX class probable F420-dependent enzyme
MSTVEQIYRAGAGLPDWAEQVLQRRTYAVLATNNPDGSPQTVPLLYTFDGERFLFESRSTTRKVRNLTDRPHARVLVQGPPDDSCWIAAEGSAEIVGGAEAQRRNATVAERYLTDAGRVGWARTVAPVEDVSIALVPARWSWWSPEAMFEVISDHGYTEEEAAGWFLPMDA